MLNSPPRPSKLKTLMASITLALSSQGLQAEGLDIGITAYQEEQFSKALEIFQLHATKGEHTARYYLSVLYRLGLGIEQDENAAFLWCKQAALQGGC